MLPAWTKSVKRKAISTAKFYYFDIGVKNILADIKSIDRNSDIYGKVFEHFIACELRAYISYRKKYSSVSYWQSKSGYEVDFIIDDSIAIEVKSSERIQAKHLKGLKALDEENKVKQYYLISHDKINQKIDNKFNVMYWEDFLKLLWRDEIF